MIWNETSVHLREARGREIEEKMADEFAREFHAKLTIRNGWRPGSECRVHRTKVIHYVEKQVGELMPPVLSHSQL